MLKTVSAVVNAIGALNYNGAWNATTNTPALASGVGTGGGAWSGVAMDTSVVALVVTATYTV